MDYSSNQPHHRGGGGDRDRGHDRYHDRDRGRSSYSSSRRDNRETKERSRSRSPIRRPGDGSGGGLAPVVARHYNQIEEKGLEAREGSKIVILRKYNNWAKSMNFNDAMKQLKDDGKPNNSLTGLDLCCGKGGDLQKWEKSRMMRHVVFVDIAEVSVKNCRERYEDMKRKHEAQRQRRGGPPLFTAEFLVADCTKESVKSKLSDPEMQFDVVSCQFSIHYSFESKPQAEQMLKNVTENLVSGGFFIGTTINADRIVKRRRECGKEAFGNEVYKIRFECDEPYPVYGARYFFELEDAVSCPEFLVNFPSFERMAEHYRLSLVYRHSFENFHKVHIENPGAKSLLNGMGALEAYPASSRDPLHFDEKNYEHAKNYIQHLKAEDPRHQGREDLRIGTISTVEWEAIRLYLAFCFRKK